MPENIIRLPSLVQNVSMANDKAFGLARPIPRVHHKGSIVLQADASGNWVPQQSTLVFFENGVNDNYLNNLNPYANSGISGLPQARSVEFTNAMKRGGFSMVWHAILLALGIMVERVRVIAADANNIAGSGSPINGARVQRSGGTVGDNEWALVDRLLPNLMGASEFQLLPVNNATECNLLLGIPQTYTAGTGWQSSDIPGLGQNTPIARYVFRDDIVLDPGVNTTDQPNRIQWSFSGLIASIERLTDSAPRAAGTLLAVDVIILADAAYGVLKDNGDFQFATDFDQKKYEAYRDCV